jgi:DNA polymerase
MDKKESLRKLEEEMRGDKSLQLDTNLVFGEGDLNCKVMFIGEAPGEQEDIQKRPFVGRGGQLLNRMLEKIGWRREDVYITNIVKRRPPNNRDPLPEEIEAYKPYLTKQIEIINPKIIVTLGRFSMNYFNQNLKISRDHGKVFRMNGRLLVPMYHPAAVLRNPNLLDEYEKEFKKLPKILEKFDELLKSAPKDKTTENPAMNEEPKLKHPQLF